MTITNAIIALTTLVSLYAFNSDKTTGRLMMNPYLIATRGQYYRFLTSGFIHNDFVHLLWNMLSFYFFGTVVERIFNIIFGESSGVYFVLLYILGIVVSDIPTYFKNKSNPGYNALGASGGVAAIIFSSIIFVPLQNICIYFAFCMPGFILGALYLIWSYYQGRKKNDNINHDAHLYGALFGLAFCIVTYPTSIVNFFRQIMEWNIFD